MCFSIEKTCCCNCNRQKLYAPNVSANENIELCLSLQKGKSPSKGSHCSLWSNYLGLGCNGTRKRKCLLIKNWEFPTEGWWKWWKLVDGGGNLMIWDAHYMWHTRHGILCNPKTWQIGFCKYWENSQQISITDG